MTTTAGASNAASGYSGPFAARPTASSWNGVASSTVPATVTTTDFQALRKPTKGAPTAIREKAFPERTLMNWRWFFRLATLLLSLLDEQLCVFENN